jgi:AraC-like DNA-binding protein
VHPAVRWCTERIAATGGKVTVAALAGETGYSRKHLSQLFGRQVGLSPKALARVHRFRGAMRLLDDPERVPWAGLADQCGYYDQSHLTNEFRRFSGFTPTEIARHSRPDSQSIVIR